MSTSIIEFVQQQEPLFCNALTDQTITWAKESQFAIQAFQRNDSLAKVAMENPASAQNAIINVAAIGITLNPASKLAYLVPRNGFVCLDISYMGLMHLAQVTQAIEWGQCKLVHENDVYESNGLDTPPTHKYNAFSDRGSVIGGYCTVKTASGDYLTEEMRLDEIKAVEATSKSRNGPWKTWWDEMARKTIVKRASKYWPRRERLDQAIDYVNTEAGEGNYFDAPESKSKDITPASEDQLKAITDLMLKVNGEWSDAFFTFISKKIQPSNIPSRAINHI
ncbi:recombination and repair protein RecT [Proteus mirabilis]|uniref:Recombination and repair protein RecT n=1 Tax=Proteus mirabilis TaxID=584 RepID=A0A2X2BKH0_PROMI|nr:recombination and repair protein RecT [Proteus mirabilis]